MKALGDRRRGGLPALRQPADLLLAAGARGRVRARAARRSTRASASWSGARSPAACCRASTAATRAPSRQSRHLTDWDEPPVHDEDRLYDTSRRWSRSPRHTASRPPQVALAWLLGRPAVTSVIVGARTERAARGQPRGRPSSRCASEERRAPRRGQRAAAALSLLAPGAGGRRPAGAGRPVPARPASAALRAGRRARGRYPARPGFFACRAARAGARVADAAARGRAAHRRGARTAAGRAGCDARRRHVPPAGAALVRRRGAGARRPISSASRRSPTAMPAPRGA